MKMLDFKASFCMCGTKSVQFQFASPNLWHCCTKSVQFNLLLDHCFLDQWDYVVLSQNQFFKSNLDTSHFSIKHPHAHQLQTTDNINNFDTFVQAITGINPQIIPETITFTSNPSVTVTMELSSILWRLFSMLIAMLLSTLIRQKKSNPLPPGPKSLPFVGCIFQMLRNRPTFEWMHKIMHEMNTEIACFRLGGIHVIPVTSPEIACEFLKKQDSIFSSRPVCMSAELPSSKYLSAVLSPSGNQQKKMKKIVMSSVLSPAKHRWLHSKRIKEADHLLNYILNQCNNSLTGGEVNIRIAARHYCGNVTRRMFFDKRFFGRGMEDGGPGTEEVEHVEALFTILDHLFAFSLSDYVPWMRSFDMDGHEKILSTAVESVRKYQDPEIDKRIEMWKNGLKKEEEDLLDVLIRLRDGTGRPLLTTEEIKAQVMVKTNPILHILNIN